MLVLQPKQVKIFLLVIIGLCGLSAGFFTAQLTGFLLRPPTSTAVGGLSLTSAQSPRPKEVDTDLIVKKNIFDPQSRGQTGEPVPADMPETAEPVTTVVAGNLKLLGTVDGGDNPLALIEESGQVNIYRLGDRVPGGGELLSVARNEVIIGQPDGRQAKLEIIQPEIRQETAGVAPAAGDGIRRLNESRWQVSRDEVEKARNNLNQLLKSARMEPNIINGQTEGFIVRMVRPQSLLAQLGLRRGDTVTRVNGVELNSPEKALQIFQQLREATRLSVDLKRGNENLTFEYEVY